MKTPPTIPLTIILPVTLVRRINLRAMTTGINRSSLLRSILLQAFPEKK